MLKSPFMHHFPTFRCLGKLGVVTPSAFLRGRKARGWICLLFCNQKAARAGDSVGMMWRAWVGVMDAAVYAGYLFKRDWRCQRGREVGQGPCVVSYARDWGAWVSRVH